MSARRCIDCQCRHYETGQVCHRCQQARDASLRARLRLLAGLAEALEVVVPIAMHVKDVRAEVGVAVDLAAYWRRQHDHVLSVLRELVDTLPRCDDCRCPATRAIRRGEGRWCDEHGPAEAPGYPRAMALRDAAEILGGDR